MKKKRFSPKKFKVVKHRVLGEKTLTWTNSLRTENIIRNHQKNVNFSFVDFYEHHPHWEGNVYLESYERKFSLRLWQTSL